MKPFPSFYALHDETDGSLEAELNSLAVARSKTRTLDHCYNFKCRLSDASPTGS